MDLEPGELWLLTRLGDGTVVDLEDPRIVGAHTSLRERGLIEDAHLRGEGESVYARVADARREGLAQLLEGWEPERHDEVRAMLDRLTRELVAEIPPSPS